MQGRARVRAVTGVVVLLVAFGTRVEVALALDEAQIVEVTCTGLRTVQQGLPPDTEVSVRVLDATRGGLLAAVDGVSGRGGRLDVPVAVDLRGVEHLVVEVVREGPPEVEYGEAATTARFPAAASPSSAAATSGSPPAVPAAAAVPARVPTPAPVPTSRVPAAPSPAQGPVAASFASPVAAVPAAAPVADAHVSRIVLAGAAALVLAAVASGTWAHRRRRPPR